MQFKVNEGATMTSDKCERAMMMMMMTAMLPMMYEDNHIH